MLTTVKLTGQLATFAGKRTWRFDIKTPAEAVAALEMARPGFRNKILSMTRHAFMVDVGGRLITDKHLLLPAGGRTVTISPILEGAASSKGIIQIIAGVVLIAASIVLSPYTAGTSLAFIPSSLALLGVSVALGGVATLLAPSPPQQNSGKDGKNKGSNIFDGAENSMSQGGPVNIALGRVMCGSQVISADITATDVGKGSNKGSDPSENTGKSVRPGNPGGPAGPAYAIQ